MRVNFLKKISLLLILLGIVSLNSTCTKQRLFEKVTYKGHVYDKNGNPAPGIQVRLEACGGGSADASIRCSNNKFEIGTVYTDQTGYFYIHERAATSGGYFVSYNGIGWNIDAVGESELTTQKYTELHLP